MRLVSLRVEKERERDRDEEKGGREGREEGKKKKRSSRNDPSERSEVSEEVVGGHGRVEVLAYEWIKMDQSERVISSRCLSVRKRKGRVELDDQEEGRR